MLTGLHAEAGQRCEYKQRRRLPHHSPLGMASPGIAATTRRLSPSGQRGRVWGSRQRRHRSFQRYRGTRLHEKGYCSLGGVTGASLRL